MGYAQFLVLFRHGHWLVRSSQTGEEPFPDQPSATKAAVEAAHESGKDGLPGAVILQVGDDDYEVVWRYGCDPYPIAISSTVH